MDKPETNDELALPLSNALKVSSNPRLKKSCDSMVGYQIRNALKARNASGDTAPVNFSPFEAAYQVLTDKLRPQVFTLGFLR